MKSSQDIVMKNKIFKKSNLSATIVDCQIIHRYTEKYQYIHLLHN